MLDRVRLSLLLAGTVLQSALFVGSVNAQDASDASTASGEVTLDTIRVSPDAADRFDKHQGSADRAQSIYIAIEEIQRTDPQTLRDLFAGNASISVGGGIPTAQKVFVNGIDENNLAVSVDGVQQGNRIFHHTSTNYIDPALLKAVRVDPGVAPADAGFGALGGSIVYETVDVQDLLINDRNFGAFATLSYETNGNTFTESAAAYGRYQGFELLGFAKFANGDDYENGDGWAVPGTAAEFSSLLAKGAYETETGYRFELSAQQIIDDALRPYRANIGGLNGTSATRVYDTTRRNFSFNFGKEEIEGLWNPKVVVGYSENSFKIPEPYGSESTGGTWTAKAENVFEISEGNTVTTGVDFISQTTDYSDPGAAYTEKVSNIGGFAQARLTPIDRLKISFGGRADGNYFEGKDGTNLDNFGLSGNASAEVEVINGISVNAGYSNVFGGIDLEESFEYWRTWDYSNLDPVRSDNVTAGLKYENAGWFAGADVFNTRFWDYRDGASNIDFSSWGYKLSGGYNWGNGFVKLSYADTRLSLADSVFESYSLINIGAAVGQIISGEIAHTFNKYDLTLGATLDAALAYDGFVSSDYGTIDPYTIVSAYAEYKPEQYDFLSLRLEANNIFDQTYSDRATYGGEYDSITPLYEPGRSFRLMAKLRY
ncbi:TonB-dependent receptor [Roseibium polysiphoniae]|uniref:TonB-dependent receptor n=1 Tax=Roseibium polysiphoniae TaxID=2571221 RepID=A0A944C9U0_9HYPH|nr:TonB-dependent receptor [Roseibium polysiphoniae]MBS8258612.1 TonB-dependent receptor [Roseibium polysiphoniae]